MPANARSRPRLVLVTRPTWLEELLMRHGTLGQAAFYLESRGQSIDRLIKAHERFHRALTQVLQTLPPDQRRTQVQRDELDRFLFAPDDVVLIVGQDGLVPNTAKYLSGQLTVGINSDPELFEGVLCPHHVDAVPQLLHWLEHRGSAYCIEQRVLAQAQREDGQQLLAMNDVFIGHASHQTARYVLSVGDRQEQQFSSGVICSTGTGMTGWARSIVQQRGIKSHLPGPESPRLAWFVREPWLSVASAGELNFGILKAPRQLSVLSQMSQAGVVFADGIESDRLEFLEGHSVSIGIAGQRLNLVMPARRG